MTLQLLWEEYEVLRSPAKQMIKAVFFDVGGVLLEQDSSTFERYDREQGWLEGAARKVWTAHLNEAHLNSQVSLSDYQGIDVASIRRRLYATNRAVPEVEKLVQHLRSSYRIAVISNFTADLDEVLDQIGLRSYFELVVNSSKVGIRKPDDRIYMLACPLLDLNPAESLFIDDNHDNVIAAQRLGMKGILFRSTASLRVELGKLDMPLLR